MSASVLLRHGCPVCGTSTEEVYVKRIIELQTQNRQVIDYKFIKCLDGANGFERFHINSRMFLICPSCGTVLSGEHWETEEDYMDET